MVLNSPCAAEEIALGLHGMQHRAQDDCGITTTDGTNFFTEKGPGTVRANFDRLKLERLRGRLGLGHIRYPTVTDDPSLDNVQPIVQGDHALGHNGNLTNFAELRKTLEMSGAFATSMDSECISRLLNADSTRDLPLPERLATALYPVRGSYALGILKTDAIIGIRDPSGNKPLSIGRRENTWYLSSETVALQGVSADLVRDVFPGEAVVINERGLESYPLAGLPPSPLAPCVFEEIYYSHPASQVFGAEKSLSYFREDLGRRLAKSCRDLGIEVIVPVPDSSNWIARGVALELGINLLDPAIVRSHYIGRTFIAPTQALRNASGRQKFSLIADRVCGKVVGLVDDSIVRLTTLPLIVELLFRAGARAVHVLVGCPPIKHPCLYGINTPMYGELAAANQSIEEMRVKVGVDSLTFTAFEDLVACSGEARCFACMTGEYRLPK